MERRLPIGIELVRKGVITENDIQKALEYQKTHSNKKMGDILNELKSINPSNWRNPRRKSNFIRTK